MRCERIEGWEGEYSKTEAARLLFGIVFFGLVRIAGLCAIVLWFFPGVLFFGGVPVIWWGGFAAILAVAFGSCYVIHRCQQRYMAIRGLVEV